MAPVQSYLEHKGLVEALTVGPSTGAREEATSSFYRLARADGANAEAMECLTTISSFLPSVDEQSRWENEGAREAGETETSADHEEEDAQQALEQASNRQLALLRQHLVDLMDPNDFAGVDQLALDQMELTACEEQEESFTDDEEELDDELDDELEDDLYEELDDDIPLDDGNEWQRRVYRQYDMNALEPWTTLPSAAASLRRAPRRVFRL